MNLIPFKNPSVGPQSRKELQSYAELTKGMKENMFSPCVSWVITQMTSLTQELAAGTEEAQMLVCVEQAFQGAPRLQFGWNTVLYFTKKVLEVILNKYI